MKEHATKGNSVQFVGWGTFGVQKRAARKY